MKALKSDLTLSLTASLAPGAFPIAPSIRAGAG
jgi:hypothetical protein